MFIFTLQSSQLSVCVCLRSTDLVMNNLFHAGNTFCETQESSVETLQSTDWGVLNYNPAILRGSLRNTHFLSPLRKMSLSSACLNLTHIDANLYFIIITFYFFVCGKTCWISGARNRTFHITTGLAQFAVWAASVLQPLKSWFLVHVHFFFFSLFCPCLIFCSWYSRRVLFHCCMMSGCGTGGRKGTSVFIFGEVFRKPLK